MKFLSLVKALAAQPRHRDRPTPLEAIAELMIEWVAGMVIINAGALAKLCAKNKATVVVDVEAQLNAAYESGRQDGLDQATREPFDGPEPVWTDSPSEWPPAVFTSAAASADDFGGLPVPTPADPYRASTMAATLAGELAGESTPKEPSS
jgi:hypothetical protein